MHSLKPIVLIFAAVLFCAPVAFAESPGAADSLFANGADAFGQGDFERALEYFRAAEKAGLDSAALHYNLGVTYFKLNRYREARKEFEQLTADSRTAPLAHYNLGRIASAQGDDEAAARHFQITARTAINERLRTLADDRLRELAQVSEASRWSGYLSLAGGYDDNVALIADSEVLVGDISDEFLEFIGAVTGQLIGTGDNGLQLKSTGYYQDYLSENEYDFGNFRIGPEYDREFGAWNTSLGGYADISYIDRDLFERIFTAEVNGSREISPNLLLNLEYQFSVIDAESPYDDLTGNRQRISADLRSTVFGAYTGVGYTFELNNRDDSDFPTRHSVSFLVDKDLTEAWAVGATGSYRYSDFQDTDRHDERLWLTARISRSIPWDFRVFGRYDYIDNASNIEEDEYTSNVYFIGIERFF